VADLYTFFSQGETDERESEKKIRTQSTTNTNDYLLDHSREAELNSM